MSAKIYKSDIDKLDYLESIIMRSAQLETLVSNLIDFIIEKKNDDADQCLNLIKTHIPDKYDAIYKAVDSFVYNYDLIVCP